MAVVAIALAFLVKGVLAQAFFIPSESMYPQLTKGDRVVVSRVAYQLHDPRRGDIVVFPSPADTPPKDTRSLPRRAIDSVLETIAVKQPRDTELIKRVIGLPGETIEARGGQIYIDGRPLREPYLRPGVTTADFGPTVIPKAHLFCMGDNRGDSHDSRFSDIGPIPISVVVGRAIARVWPSTRVAFL
jgi:signal peptidase I